MQETNDWDQDWNEDSIPIDPAKAAQGEAARERLSILWKTPSKNLSGKDAEWLTAHQWAHRLRLGGQGHSEKAIADFFTAVHARAAALNDRFSQGSLTLMHQLACIEEFHKHVEYLAKEGVLTDEMQDVLGCVYLAIENPDALTENQIRAFMKDKGWSCMLAAEILQRLELPDILPPVLAILDERMKAIAAPLEYRSPEAVLNEPPSPAENIPSRVRSR